MTTALLIVSAVMLAAWGIAHALATRGVVGGFAEISQDNRRVVVMEWLNESILLLFIAALLLVVALLSVDTTGTWVLVVCVVALNAMSVLSLFTGFRINFLPYRLCPPIFTGTSLLVIAALLAT
ncbi:MAG TPA: hypothetical protein VES03_02975 [Motilibacterales bacterium]|nr:hypothetical protein [Motilibacterales bacterium]